MHGMDTPTRTRKGRGRWHCCCAGGTHARVMRRLVGASESYVRVRANTHLQHALVAHLRDLRRKHCA